MLAWALKDFATRAWASNPPDVVTTADTLDSLVNVCIPEPSNFQAETEAIAAWVRGLALLTKGEAILAIDSLDNAAAKFSSIEQTTNAAHTQSAKMMALSQIGKDDLAIETGLTAYETLSIAHEELAAAKISLNLGNLFWNKGAYSKSIEYCERAQESFEHLHQLTLAVAARVNKSNALAFLGKFDEALENYALARSICQRDSLFAYEATVTEWIALIHLARGNYAEALRDLEISRSRYEVLQINQNLAFAEQQLADTYFELGMAAEATNLFEQAKKRFEALAMHNELGWVYVQLALTRASIDVSSSEIDALLARAKDTFSKQQLDPGQAAVTLASARVALGRANHEHAVSLAHAASNAFAGIGQLRQRLLADVVLSKALLMVGQTNEAVKLLLSTLSVAREKQLSNIAIECHQALGDSEYKVGARANAREHFSTAVSISEGLRSALRSDRMRSAFLDDRLQPYRRLLGIDIDEHESSPSHEHAIRAFAAAERLRARSLEERLGESRANGSATQDESPETSLRARLNWIQRRQQKLADEGETDESLTVESARLERELLEQHRRRDSGSIRNTRGVDFDESSWASLLAQIDEKTLFVEYVVLEDELLAFIVRDGQVTIRRRIASWQSVLNSIEVLRFQLETMRYGLSTMQSHAPRLVERANQALAKLFSQLWAPLAVTLNTVEQVVVSPSGRIAAVPFCALFDAATQCYLGEQVAISYSPSATLFAQRFTGTRTTIKKSIALAETTRLAHAFEEIMAVSEAIPATLALAGDTATIEQLQKASVDGNLLHLACHASFRSDNPSFSALQLEDGPFTVFDAESLRLRDAIVVLSACDTATAQDTAGDEMFGLVRGFMIGGASTVVASLWAIDDEATKRFMPPFYETLKATGSPASALRVAQSVLKATHPHPYYWAAFVAYGAP